MTEGLAGKSLRRSTSVSGGASPQRKTRGQRGPKKLIVPTDQHPAVAPCDISQNSDAFLQDRDCALPDVVGTEVVRRLKQEMRAGFRFEPGRLGPDRNRRTEEGAMAESQPTYAPVPHRGPDPDHQEPLQEQTGDPPFLSWARCTFAKWTSSGTGGGAPEDPGIEGAESVSNRNACKPPVRTNIGQRSSGTPSFVEENGDCENFCNRTPGSSEVSGTSLEASSREDQAGGCDLSETCQRVRVHVRKDVFSCARTDMPWPLTSSSSTRTHVDAPACLAPPADASDAAANERLFHAPGGRPSDLSRWINHQAGVCTDRVLTGLNEELQGETSTHSPDTKDSGFALDLLQAEEAGPSPPLEGTRESSPSPQAGHQSDRSGSSPSHCATVLSDIERTSSLYSISPPPLPPPSGVSLPGASSPCSIAKPLEKQWFFSEDTRMASCSSSFAPANSCDSLYSSESSLLLPQVVGDRDEDPTTTTLLPNYERSPSTDEEAACFLLYQTCRETASALPPLLSPVASPHRSSWGSLLSWSPGSSDREEEDTCTHKSPPLVDGDGGRLSVDLQRDLEGSGEVSEPASPTRPQFSPSDQNGAWRSSPSAIASVERDQTCHDFSSDDLDEVTAFERDILLVDVTQDDSELFENLPQKSLLRLGPVRVSKELKHKPLRAAIKPNSGRAPVEFDQK